MIMFSKFIQIFSSPALHEFGSEIGGSQEKTSEQESQRQYELVHCLASKADLIVVAAGSLLLSLNAKAM